MKKLKKNDIIILPYNLMNFIETTNKEVIFKSGENPIKNPSEFLD